MNQTKQTVTAQITLELSMGQLTALLTSQTDPQTAQPTISPQAIPPQQNAPQAMQTASPLSQMFPTMGQMPTPQPTAIPAQQIPAQTVQPTAIPTQPTSQPSAPTFVPQAHWEAPVSGGSPQPTAMPTQQTTPAYSAQQLSLAARPIMESGRRQELEALLTEFGVKSLTAIPEERRADFAARLRAMGGQI